jgi:hypothetical protein
MRELDLLSRFFGKLANLAAAWERRSDFTCGECERWQRCGRPPSDDCIVKAEQLARRQSATPPNKMNACVG